MDSTSKFNSKQVMKFIIIDPNYGHYNYKSIKTLSRLIWLSTFFRRTLFLSVFLFHLAVLSHESLITNRGKLM